MTILVIMQGTRVEQLLLAHRHEDLRAEHILPAVQEG